MKEITKHYTNGEVTIVWRPSLCIHSGNCWRGLQEVFHPEQRPWITPEASSTEKIVDQVKQCPSGALKYYFNNEAIKETEMESQQVTIVADDETRIEIKPNGPLRAYGKLRVELPNGEVIIKETAASFCRCGHSKNKPFCDSSHREMGFVG